MANPSTSRPRSRPARDGKRRVIIELRGPAVGGGMEMAMGMQVEGLVLDPNYGAIPMTNGQAGAAMVALAAPTYVVRGEVDDAVLPTLEAQPNVVGVWTDAEIAPFSADETDAGMAPGDCPIPPCDCASNVPKGTIMDVANYLKVDQVWAAGIKGTGIVVGIVDGGITAKGRPINAADTSHPQWPGKLIPRVTGGWPTADWGTTGFGWGWHGNMTSTDALGMAPDAEIYDLRIADATTSVGVVSNALAAFQWAITTFKATGKPQILSNSWGMWQKNWAADYATNPNHPFTKKVVEAIDAGIIVLFAAGNCGKTCGGAKCGTDLGPGKSIWGANGHPRVMTVGAVNKNEEFVGYSSQGPAALDPKKPDFCGITHFTGFFNSDSGTSAATPVVAGVAALMKQKKPAATHDQIKKCLQNTAKDIGPGGWDPHSGYGIVQGKAAVDCVGGGIRPPKALLDTIKQLDVQTVAWKDKITIAILDKQTLPTKDKLTTALADKITISILDRPDTLKTFDDVKKPLLDKNPISDRIDPIRDPIRNPIQPGAAPFVLSTPHHAPGAAALEAELAGMPSDELLQQYVEAMQEIEQTLAQFDAAAEDAVQRALAADAELVELQAAHASLVEQYRQMAAESAALAASQPSSGQ